MTARRGRSRRRRRAALVLATAALLGGAAAVGVADEAAATGAGGASAPSAAEGASPGSSAGGSRADARAPGADAEMIATLRAALARIADPDPDTRLRARRRARELALAHYRAHAPAGMRLVPAPVQMEASGIRCEGGFYLAVYEVTRGEMHAFAAARDGRDRWGGGDPALPATDVSLREARAFAAARGARLPTAAELARAARAGETLRYPWGDEFAAFRVNTRETGRGGPERVASRPAGDSAHGLAHLLGNVAEWTETTTERGNRYLAVGGSYRTAGEPGHRPTYRLSDGARLPDVGFRLAKSLPSLTLGEE